MSYILIWVVVTLIYSYEKMYYIVHLRGSWVAQSVRHLTSAQVMISRFVSSSPVSGSKLTVRSLLGILSPSLSAPTLLALYQSIKCSDNPHFPNLLRLQLSAGHSGNRKV